MKTGTLVLLYETGALSAGVITGDYRSIYSTTKDGLIRGNSHT